MQGWTPLHCAVDNLYPAVVKLLLDRCTQEALNAADVKVLLTFTLAHFLWVKEAHQTAFVLYRCTAVFSCRRLFGGI